MKLRDWLDDLTSVMAQRFWVKRTVGAVALVASLISTYHRINVDRSQIPVEPEETPQADSNRSPSSFGNPVVATTSPLLTPKKVATPPSAKIPSDGEAELVSFTTPETSYG